MLGAIAATTTRIRFGALLTPLARRRPTKVARETVTLDHLSKGRLIFGAALGWSGTEEFEDLGEPGDARIRADKLDEALNVITALWTGEPVDHEGEHYTVRDTQFLPRADPHDPDLDRRRVAREAPVPARSAPRRRVPAARRPARHRDDDARATARPSSPTPEATATRAT